MAIATLLCAAPGAHATPPAGTVSALSGRLLAKSPVGQTRLLSLDSPLQVGDLIASKANTYARMTLAGGKTVTLEPDTVLKIERVSVDAVNLQAGAVVLRLKKGGVHVAACANDEAGKGGMTLATPYATVDAPGAIFVAEAVTLSATAIARRRQSGPQAPVMLAYNAGAGRADVIPVPVAAFAPAHPAQTGGREAGLYLQVLGGSVRASGNGARQFTAGQFGYISASAPPAVLSSDPGMQFSPPVSFASAAGPQSVRAACPPR